MRLFVIGLLTTVVVSCVAETGPVPISGDVPEAAGWRTEVVASGLSHPWSIAWLPDGSALVTERIGRLRLIRDGQLDPRPISGLPPFKDRKSNRTTADIVARVQLKDGGAQPVGAFLGLDRGLDDDATCARKDAPGARGGGRAGLDRAAD